MSCMQYCQCNIVQLVHHSAILNLDYAAPEQTMLHMMLRVMKEGRSGVRSRMSERMQN